MTDPGGAVDPDPDPDQPGQRAAAIRRARSPAAVGAVLRAVAVSALGVLPAFLVGALAAQIRADLGVSLGLFGLAAATLFIVSGSVARPAAGWCSGWGPAAAPLPRPAGDPPSPTAPDRSGSEEEPMSICRLHPPGPRPDQGLLARCRALPTSILSDCMARTGGVSGVRPVPGGGWPRIAGPALTVRTRPGDNLVVHRALDLAEPGDVLVVDGGGALDRAVLGEIMARYAAARGLAALVVDGAVRDAEGLAAGAVPVFARGVNHLGPYKEGPGEIGGPVSAGGTVVRSGDVVVGDADGVAVVPHERLAEVVAAGEDQLRAEDAIFAAIAAGTWDRAWVTAALTEVRVTS